MQKHYIIGDIHGEYKTLLKLIDKLPKDAKLIFVGDLIDRGLQSREIIYYIREHNHQVVRGNHEQFMIEDGQKLINKLLADEEVNMSSIWIFADGIETLLSYGLLEKQDDSYQFIKNMDGIAQLQDDIEWMNSLPLYIEMENPHNSKLPIVVSYASIGSFWDLKESNYKHFEFYIMTNRKRPSANAPIFNIYGHTNLHTLFIKLVADTIENEGYSLDDILQKFENGELSKIEFIDEESGDEVTFNQNLQELFSMQNLKDEYVLLLKRLAVLPSIDIELNFLNEIFAEKLNGRLNGRLNFLVGPGWLIESEGRYKLHQIIKEFVLANHAPCFEEIKIIIDYFNNLIDYSRNPKTAIIVQPYFPYIDSIVLIVKKLEIKNLELAKFYMSLGNIYNTLGDYQNSIIFIKLSRNLYHNISGEDDIMTSTLNHNLGQLYYMIGEDEKALPLIVKDLEIAKSIFDKNNLDFASSYANIANILLRKGEYAKAINLHQLALDISLYHLGEKNLETAIHYNNLAMVYHHIGKDKESLVLFKKSINIIIEVEEKEHPHLIGGYNNLGEVYTKQKKYKQALFYLNKALEIGRKIFNNNHHPNLGIVYGNIGLVYYGLKKYQKAYDYTHTCVSIFEKQLSSNHHDLIAARYELEKMEQKLDNQKNAVLIKISRNDPCPCNSGKKYKKCCGKPK
jgi:serine/threonine protein phosphatase 1